MARVIPLGSSEDEQEQKPILLEPVIQHRRPKPPPPLAPPPTMDSKPRRSIYPPPSVQRPDVKPDIKPRPGVLASLGENVDWTGGGGGGNRLGGAGGAKEQQRPHEQAAAGGELSYQAKQRVKQEQIIQQQELEEKVQNLDDEIDSMEDQIVTLTTLVSALKEEREALVSSSSTSSSNDGGFTSMQERVLKPTQNGGTDYLGSNYEWSQHMKSTMKNVFVIQNYRLCQEGVCNANMDGRDIICIMPTGGGKSLTYQLPAILTTGTTIVISPLLSLITDQLIHLHENDIPSVMLTGSVPKHEADAISRRLVEGPTRASGSNRSQAGQGGSLSGEDGREIKLVYVTPEKVSKSKQFTSMLQKMHTQGRLARFVIDEAHCVSQLGHDYRPDYNKLSILRTFFPGVPIMAVTATCSRKVLPDLLKTLNMGPITPSNDANNKGTVFFDAPLYRKNLHYKVEIKPSSAKTALVAMSDYILKHHANESGIVYCLSKKDAQTVADGLLTSSNGKIKTGVYHADVDDYEKQKLHRRWREGKVNVVVATIAFGLGIDKGNVRFVLHHSLSKSLDGYYQETGRAGRDGEDASCVLFYRAQDASRMSSLTAGDQEAQPKLREMIAYAQDLETCRKILFGRYFSTSASLPSKSWAEKEEKCGHCDNCTRDPDSIERKDVTIEAWKICKVSQYVHHQDGRITVSALGDLVRGLGGGTFSIVETGKKGKRKQSAEKATIDLDRICGGKSELGKDAVESLIMRLLLDDYLGESYQATSYATNVYVIPGPRNMRLARYSKEEINSGVRIGGDPIIQVFPVKSRKKAPAAKKTTAAGVKRSGSSTTTSGGKGKGKAKLVSDDDEEEEDEEDENIDEDDEEEEEDGFAQDDYNNFESQYVEDEDEEIYAQLNAGPSPSPPPARLQPPSKPKPSSNAVASSSKPKPQSKSKSKPKPRTSTSSWKLPDSDEDDDQDAWNEFDNAQNQPASSSFTKAVGRGAKKEEEDPWETVISPVVQIRRGLSDAGGGGSRNGSRASAEGGEGGGKKKRKVERDDGGGSGSGTRWGEPIVLSD